MTIIDTTLYANGQLRLSRHGAGRGDTVLMRTDATGFQFTIPDNLTEGAINEIEAELDDGVPVARIWDNLIDLYQDDIVDFAPR